jgi:hypothetical protein
LEGPAGIGAGWCNQVFEMIALHCIALAAHHVLTKGLFLPCINNVATNS